MEANKTQRLINLPYRAITHDIYLFMRQLLNTTTHYRGRQASAQLNFQLCFPRLPETLHKAQTLSS